uniref:DUF4408 domain-containing protein n=1 Tax=Kalanchoe fedtschenkoi TaxID=63787 RepID=A0A7N0SVJ5_KALFE
MDPIKIEKFEAMNKFCNNRMHLHQSSMKNNVKNSNAFIVYVLTALTCSLVFFGPFWYPSFESLIVSIPALVSHFCLSPKCVFIVGNLIVLGLVGESKLLASKHYSSQPAALHEVYYDEYVSRRQSLKQQRPVKADNAVVHKECSKKVGEVSRSAARSRSVRKVELGDRNKEAWSSKGSTLSAEELSKRADDFIARVNRQRKLEAADLVEWGM